MNKQFKERTYYYIEYQDFDKLVEDLLGFEYECVAENEWNNASCYDFNIKKSELESDFYQKYCLPKIQKAIEIHNGLGIKAVDILIYLVGIGELNEGNYIIDVSW